MLHLIRDLFHSPASYISTRESRMDQHLARLGVLDAVQALRIEQPHEREATTILRAEPTPAS